jgi:ketosteroid isomerase-like protein
MKSLFIFAASTLLATGLVSGQTSGGVASAELKQEMMKLHHSWDDAFLKRDAKAVDALLADEYVSTGPDGERYSKKQTIDDMKSGVDVVEAAFTDEFQITPYGNDMVVVRSRWAATETYKGKQTKGQYRYTDVWVKRDGRWQVVADHGSRIEPQEESAQKDLIKLENDWNDALVKKDGNAINRMLAKEYVLTRPDGSMATKAELDSDLQSGVDKITAASSDDIKVLVFGDSAVVTSRWTGKETYKGQDVSGAYRATDFFIYRDGRWQAAATHLSKLGAK